MVTRRGAQRGPVCWLGLLAAAVVAALFVLSAPAAAGDADVVDALPDRWRVWLEEEIYPLITKEQKQAFLRLETEAQRGAFAERLWVLWGQESGLGSSFRQLYLERLDICRLEFESTREDRARVLLIHGPPDFLLESRCEDVFVPIEVWGWEYIEGLGESVVALFYRPDGLGRFRMWSAMDSDRALYTWQAWDQRTAGYQSRFDQPQFQCMDGDTIVRMIASAAAWSRDPRYMQAMYKLTPSRREGAESASRRFMEFSALVDKDAEPLAFTVAPSATAQTGGKVTMAFALSVPGGALGHTAVGEVAVAQVDVVGEISRRDRMVDRFRYMFSVPSRGDELALVVERSLRPGDYQLRLKVEDVHSKHAGVSELAFRVRPDDVVAAPNAVVAELDAPILLAEETADDGPLRLVGPSGDAITGLNRFEAVAAATVQRVTFLVDGREILTKNRPPFDVDLDIGPLPRLAAISAVGFDEGGSEIARAELSVNVGQERFYLHIAPLAMADVADGKVKVSVELNVPSDAELERLDLYWNDRLLTTLFEPPFSTWVEIAGNDPYGYLRAVAVLDDARLAEDISFVSAPRFGAAVEVTAVELPVTVLDRAGKPVESLAVTDFTVRENSVVQDLTHCSLHRDLPVRMGLVIDTSGSMESSLPEVQRVVMGFLRGLLRPRDRAFIEIFSDQPEVLAPFTADFATLENALLALYADRSTALYDAVIMGLFQFSGVRGRNAIVVLTDGEDTGSKNDFATVLDYAQRRGVTIYTVAVDLPATKVMARWQLRRLAEVTGGKSFFLSGKADLEEVYRDIDRELRSQYQLAYTSSTTAPADQLRKVAVEVADRKLKVRTISGYYPRVG